MCEKMEQENKFFSIHFNTDILTLDEKKLFPLNKHRKAVTCYNPVCHFTVVSKVSPKFKFVFPI